MRVPNLLTLALTGALTAAAPAPPNGAQMLALAERSFSAIPFGTRVPPPGLVLIDDGGCVAGEGECSYRDANRVVHYFNAGELVVKSVTVTDVGAAPMAALGIGTARERAEVLARVKAFLPQAKIRCDPPSASETVCGATLGEGWFKLFFDSRNQLIEARIDAYQFT